MKKLATELIRTIIKEFPPNEALELIPMIDLTDIDKEALDLIAALHKGVQ